MNRIYESANFGVVFDEDNKTISIELRNNVSYDEFTDGMNAFKSLVLQIPQFSIVFDFQKMKDITAKARVWFQDEFLTNRGLDILERSQKCALVMPSGMLPEIIVENLQKLFFQTKPNLNLQRFGNAKKALKWVNPEYKSRKHSSLSIASFLPQSMGFKLT